MEALALAMGWCGSKMVRFGDLCWSGWRGYWGQMKVAWFGSAPWVMVSVVLLA